MSRLTELIEELCPDGVEFRPLSDLVRIRNGCDYKTLSPGNVPVYGSGGVMTHVSEALGEGPTVLIPRKGSLDNIFFVEGEFWTVDTIFYTEIASDLDPKFFYYKMKTMHLSQMNEAAGVPSMNQRKLGRIQIPVPPLEVQREIVRILDQFTTLEAELEAELEARKAQYEHYRNHLLSYESLAARGPVEMVRLGDVVSISRGASPRPISKYVTQGEGIPWIKIGDVDPQGKFVTGTAERITSAGANKARRVLPGEFILSNSMSFGRPYILQIEGCVHDGWLILSDVTDHWIPDFLYHSLRTDDVQRQFEQLASGGTVRNLNSRVIESVELCLPSKVVQEQVVSVLDRFDALVNDISSGLPAEIAARRAQYEHYRDRLLSFPEKSIAGSDAS
jgi:type i restriction enzyme ecoR124II specificity protein